MIKSVKPIEIITFTVPFKPRTVNDGMMESLSLLRKRLEVDTNTIYRSILSCKTISDETREINFTSAMTVMLHHATHKGLGVIKYNTPRKGHNSGECYDNAYKEWKATGNDPMIVWEVFNVGSIYYSISPHAVNMDKDGVIYDTGNYPHRGKQERPCFLLMDADTTKKWLTNKMKNKKTLTPTVEFGDYSLIVSSDAVYAIHSTDEYPSTPRSNPIITDIKSYDIKTLQELFHSKYKDV